MHFPVEVLCQIFSSLTLEDYISSTRLLRLRHVSQECYKLVRQQILATPCERDPNGWYWTMDNCCFDRLFTAAIQQADVESVDWLLTDFKDRTDCVKHQSSYMTVYAQNFLRSKDVTSRHLPVLKLLYSRNVLPKKNMQVRFWLGCFRYYSFPKFLKEVNDVLEWMPIFQFWLELHTDMMNIISWELEQFILGSVSYNCLPLLSYILTTYSEPLKKHEIVNAELLCNAMRDGITMPMLMLLLPHFQKDLRFQNNLLLRAAVRNGRLDIIHYFHSLVRYTAEEIRRRDNELLFRAARSEHLSVMDWLVDNFCITTEEILSCRKGQILKEAKPQVKIWLQKRFIVSYTCGLHIHVTTYTTHNCPQS